MHLRGMQKRHHDISIINRHSVKHCSIFFLDSLFTQRCNLTSIVLEASLAEEEEEEEEDNNRNLGSMQ